MTSRTNEAERGKVFAILGEAFRQKFTPTTLAAYELGLSDIPPARVKEAVAIAVRTCKFCPNPAELREILGVGATSEKDRLESAALAGWDALSDAVAKVGSYRSINFSDPIVNAVIRSLGGWPEVCDQPRAEFDKWIRHRFLETYRALDRGGYGDEQARPLAGLSSDGDVHQVDGKIARIEAKAPVEYDVATRTAIGGRAQVPALEEPTDNSGIAKDQTLPRIGVKQP